MKFIPLTKGYHAAVDDEDYDRLLAMGKWSQESVSDRSLSFFRAALIRLSYPGKWYPVVASIHPPAPYQDAALPNELTGQLF